MFADGMWAKPKYTSFFLFSQRCFLCLFKCSNFCSVFISYLMLWTKHEKEVSHHEWQLSQWVGGWFGLTWLQLQMTTRVQGGCVHDVSASFSLCTVSGSNSSWGGCACLYQTYVDMFESKLHANLMMEPEEKSGDHKNHHKSPDGNPSYHCWTVSLWTAVVNRSADCHFLFVCFLVLASFFQAWPAPEAPCFGCFLGFSYGNRNDTATVFI